MKQIKDQSLLEKINQSLEENTFIIANFKDFMTQHHQPSPVTIARFEKIEEWVKEIKKDNKENDERIIQKLNEMQFSQKVWMEKIEKDISDEAKKIRALEDWKLVSKTERAIAYSIAAFVGSIIGSLILMVFGKFIS